MQKSKLADIISAPIVLFQTQPKTNSDSETFDKIKTMLVDMGIPEKEMPFKK